MLFHILRSYLSLLRSYTRWAIERYTESAAGPTDVGLVCNLFVWLFAHQCLEKLATTIGFPCS